MRLKCLECNNIVHIEDEHAPEDYEEGDAIQDYCPRCKGQRYLVAAMSEVKQG